MFKPLTLTSFLIISIAITLLTISACKSCGKSEAVQETKTDTTAVTSQPVNAINLPHADTSLIPVLTKVLDAAFDASNKKDYTTLADLLMYRGTDERRLGADVFHAKNAYDLTVVRITSQVFNKWTSNIESKDYARVFEMDQPGDQKLEVLEVIFVSKRKVDRKFFGFLKINEAYKIADVTSNLQ